MPSAYLGGPIAALNDAQALGWRTHAALWLKRFGIDVIDPMRRDYRQGWEDPMDVVGPDLDDIREASVCLFNFWRMSAGTSMELVYAHAFGKPICAYWPHHPSPWIQAHATEVHDVLDSCIAATARMCRA